MRLPEVEAQIVFALEEGSLLPGGQWLGGGVRACLFSQLSDFFKTPGGLSS